VQSGVADKPITEVSDFIFRDKPEYHPPVEMVDFLSAGPPPVHIGFGSIVVESARKMSDITDQAVRATGVRAIVSRGWSKLQGPPNSNILYINDCPHEWLLNQSLLIIG
jgi:UDP:flavonoid glycosyltransferase YjiC (YdhE family)